VAAGARVGRATRYRGPFGPIQVDVDPEWPREIISLATNSRLTSSGTPCGCIFALPSASAMSKICWLSVGWTSPMRRLDDGC
jgi:hypothetical protein